MSREKELDFFVEEKNWGRGVAWYGDQFDDAPVRGESSVTYSAWPEYRGVSERVATVLPEVRLVYLVRDPVERVVSHYLHHSIRYPDEVAFDDLLASDLGRRLVDVSRYWTQLSRYLEHVPPERILVVDGVELHARRTASLERIFRFLGVDPAFRSPLFTREHNVATGQARRRRAPDLVLRLLQGTLGTNGAARVAAAVPETVKARLRRELERPVVRPELQERLTEELRDEVERLRAHTGQTFGTWSV
jgi:hypothetical protein